MKASDFFQRAVHIFEPPLNSIKSGITQLQKLGFKPWPAQPPFPESLLMPSTAPFTASQLAELLGFYEIVRRAHSDNVSRLLVVSPKANIPPNFDKKVSEVLDNIPSEWDLLYFGYRDASFRDKPTKDKLLYQVNYASGFQMLGINNRFYHLFLEAARVPLYPLDEHIKSVSLACNIFVINPPLVLPS